MVRLIALLVFSATAFAALPNNTTTFEVRTAGSNTNSGCFVAGSTGTDYSQQDAAQYGAADLVLVTTTTVSSASHSFDANDVGNCIFISAGVNFTVGRYQIVSVAAGVATLDRAAGTMGATGGTYAVGGALQTLAQLETSMGEGGGFGYKAWVKADGTYSISSGVTWDFGSTSSAWPIVEGYTTTRGDDLSPTVLATAAITMFTFGNNGSLNDLVVSNFILDCDATGNRGIEMSNSKIALHNIRFLDCNDRAINAANDVYCERCVATGTPVNINQTAFNIVGTFRCFYCVVGDVTASNVVAFTLSSGSVCVGCIVANIPNGTSTGLVTGSNSAGGVFIVSSVFQNIALDGVRITGTTVFSQVTIINSIFSELGRYGINYAEASDAEGGWFTNWNAYFDCATANTFNVSQGPDDVALSGNPFTNSAALDLSLNNTAGAGAAARQAGFPGTLSAGGTGFLDIGALQSQAAAAGTPVNYGFAQ